MEQHCLSPPILTFYIKGESRIQWGHILQVPLSLSRLWLYIIIKYSKTDKEKQCALCTNTQCIAQTLTVKFILRLKKAYNFFLQFAICFLVNNLKARQKYL